MNQYKHVVGIDLGTTNTLACRLKGGKLDLIKFPGGRMLPSALYVDEEGQISIGNKALKKGKLDPGNLIRSSKTYIGDFEANRVWTCNGKTFNPTDVATEILKEVRRAYCNHVRCDENEEIGAVITVPAYFNSNQTDETRKAGEAAGFHVMQIITEPMAAALAAANYLELSERKVFVFDLGGGTFDLSVLQADVANHSFKAIDIDGDPRLGGDDFDNMLVDYIWKLIEDDTGKDMSSWQKACMDEGAYKSLRMAVRDAAEACKIELSDSSEADISIPNIFADYSLDITLSRDEFDEICASLYRKIFRRVKKFLDFNSNFKKSDIGEMILAGGSCYIPHVQKEASKLFGRPAQTDMDLSTLVVAGACHVAEGNNGGLDATRLEDILSHSLGVAVRGARPGDYEFSSILAKNTPYPCEKVRIYSTAKDNQTEVKLRIYEAGSDKEGEPDVAHHKLYGTMVLEGIERARQGVPQIEVKFQYDRNRCLTVTAIDKKTGASRSLRLEKGNYAADEPETPVAVDFMLLLDTSASMHGKALHEAKKACRALVNDLIDFSCHRLGLVSFADSANLKMSLSSDRDALARKIDAFTAHGMTYMEPAMELAAQQMADGNRSRVIIAVTDGRDFSESATIALSRKLRDDGYRIVAIGSGSQVDDDFLKAVASPGDCYNIDNMSELEKTFSKVIQDITQV